MLNLHAHLGRDLWHATFHEAGHYVVSRHFGKDLGLMVVNKLLYSLETPQDTLIAARTFTREVEGFEKCSIAFGGLCGEILSTYCSGKESKLARQAMHYCISHLDELSESDQEALTCCMAQRWKACQLAASVAWKGRNEIQSIAIQAKVAMESKSAPCFTYPEGFDPDGY